jgi:hypothetical protein
MDAIRGPRKGFFSRNSIIFRRLRQGKEGSNRRLARRFAATPAFLTRKETESFLPRREKLMTWIAPFPWTGMETAVNRLEMKTINAPFRAAGSRQAA